MRLTGLIRNGHFFAKGPGFLAGVAILLACSENAEYTVSRRHSLLPRGNLYAHGFQLDSVPGWRILTVDNLWRGSNSAFRYVLRTEYSARHPLPDSLRALPRLSLPLNRIVLLSTTHLAFIQELGLAHKVVGMDNTNWIFNENTKELFDSLQVVSVGSGPSLNMEYLYRLAPEAIFSFATGNAQFDTHPRLVAARLPLIMTSDWMETHPLGRLEWIRVFGLLLGEKFKADSIFAARAELYEALAHRMHNVQNRPSILMGMPQGDAWHMPGGASYMARLVEDAGGEYIWRHDPESGSLVVSYETVFAQFSPGQLWINPGIWRNRQEALGQDGRVGLIPAFNEGAVFHYGKRTKAQGGTDFFESAVVLPHLVLADLVYLFHRDSLPQHHTIWYDSLR